MNEIHKSYAAQESQSTLVANDVTSLKLQLSEVSQKIQGVREREQQRKDDGDSLAAELTVLKVERDSLTEKRKYVPLLRALRLGFAVIIAIDTLYFTLVGNFGVRMPRWTQP